MKRYFGINKKDRKGGMTSNESNLHRIVKEGENGIFFPSNFSWKMEKT